MGEAQQIKPSEAKDAAVNALKPGTLLLRGQYRIEKALNAGGFGIAYLAKDSLDRRVVLKECFPDSFCHRVDLAVRSRSPSHHSELRTIVLAFVQEARSLAKLAHPNIVGVRQVFEENETAYMALDFIKGHDLQEMLEDPEHLYSPLEVKALLKGVLRAVGFTHRKGMLHRDISPDNILIGEDLRPVLIDFGAAREIARKDGRTHAALRAVKDGYSPQEFYISGSEQGPSSDLYSLGATFYHLIAGEAPPNGQARLAAIAAGLPDPYVPLTGRFDAYGDRFLEAIDTALEILPKNRLQSSKDWLSRIEEAPEAAGNVTPPRNSAEIVFRATPLKPTSEKSRTLVFMAIAAALALIGVGAAVQSGLLGRPTEASMAAPPALVPASSKGDLNAVKTVSRASGDEFLRVVAIDFASGTVTRPRRIFS